MGIDLHVHVGAYVEIKPKPFMRILKQCACPIHGLVSRPRYFCPECGQKIQIQEIEQEAIPSFYQILPEDEYVDRLAWIAREEKSDAIFLISNTGEGGIDFNPDGSASIVEINVGMPSRYIADFIDKHNDVLKVLRQRTISVDVKFGVLTWWS